MSRISNVTVAEKVKNKKFEAYVEVKLDISIEEATMIELMEKVNKINLALPGSEIKLLMDVNGTMKPLYIHDTNVTLTAVYNNDTNERFDLEGEE
ncbi:hypothetical protein ACERII_02070 [Evansella sp. AB-rgal1]|uniref:hypothetical protein n=1 Tax=Evansella sp. AB-rgal1 TaxID=3242696 RepID=UPI00359D6606